MSKIPAEYAWLEREGEPQMLVEAIRLYGTSEIKGRADNPTIIEWAKEVGVSNEYTGDSVPWCALFMAVVAKRARKEPPRDPLWALNWRNFGRAVAAPMLGDVLVFTRAGGGHVALYVGEDAEAFHVLGGNQGDRVSIVRKLKSEQHWCRRPLYITQPLNVRVVHLAAGGRLSTKED
jgi:uncharacterized protein (TIGR02594 family)